MSDAIPGEVAKGIINESARLAAMLAEVEEFDDLDAAYAEVARKPYGFVWAGQKWVLPHIGELDYRVQAEIESVSELTLPQINDLFKRLFGPAQADRWDAAPQPGSMLSIFFERWIKHGGRKPGESMASKRSSKSTGAKSRPTSAVSTTSASRSRSSAKPAKRAPRNAAKPTAAELAAQVDAEWLERHQELAGSPPGKSST
jgi:hypothetical protein